MRIQLLKMATEGIVLDIGAIYKRLFNHRAIVQNEVQFFIEEFESKRGDNDLKLLQSSVKLSSDINALYLEEMKESIPLFAEGRERMASIASKGNKILEKAQQNFDLPQEQSQELERELQELKDMYSSKRQELISSTSTKLEELKAEVQVHLETIERLKGGMGQTPSQSSVDGQPSSLSST